MERRLGNFQDANGALLALCGNMQDLAGNNA
jgi:hypothetical protein